MRNLLRCSCRLRWWRDYSLCRLCRFSTLVSDHLIFESVMPARAAIWENLLIFKLLIWKELLKLELCGFLTKFPSFARRLETCLSQVNRTFKSPVHEWKTVFHIRGIGTTVELLTLRICNTKQHLNTIDVAPNGGLWQKYRSSYTKVFTNPSFPGWAVWGSQ